MHQYVWLARTRVTLLLRYTPAYPISHGIRGVNVRMQTSRIMHAALTAAQLNLQYSQSTVTLLLHDVLLASASTV